AVEVIMLAGPPYGSRVFLWDKGEWYEFPNKHQPEYRVVSSSHSATIPRFRGDTAFHITPSADVASPGQTHPESSGSASPGVTAEKSGNWWWLNGNTYNHRGVLNAVGARWSMKRRQWYYIGETLPTAIQSLVNEPALDNQANVREPIGQITDTTDKSGIGSGTNDAVISSLPSVSPATPVVRPAAERPATDNGLDLFPDWLLAERPTGHNLLNQRGERIVFAKLFHPYMNWYLFVAEYDKHRKEVFCYAVLNHDFINAEWGWQSVEYLENIQRYPGSRGLPMERDVTFKTKSIQEAIAEYKYEHGFGNQSASLAAPEIPATSPAIQKPESPDVKHVALPEFVATNLPSEIQLPKGKLFVPQQYVGDINVVGSCYCYGVAVDRRGPSYRALPIYLSVVGPGTSVDALWAKLVQGKESSVACSDGKTSIPLQPNAAGVYTHIAKKLDDLSLVHLILVHEDLADPVVGDSERPTAYLISLNPEQKKAKFGDTIREIVRAAVFDEYLDYLMAEGQRRGLVRKCDSLVVDIMAITTDRKRWTELLTEGLRSKKIAFPRTTVSNEGA